MYGVGRGIRGRLRGIARACWPRRRDSRHRNNECYGKGGRLEFIISGRAAWVAFRSVDGRYYIGSPNAYMVHLGRGAKPSQNHIHKQARPEPSMYVNEVSPPQRVRGGYEPRRRVINGMVDLQTTARLSIVL